MNRPYQDKYINSIQLNKSNLLISFMRSGKSRILKGIVDKYFSDKRVLILVGMRNIVLQLSEEFDNHTFILSGKKHNPDELIHIGSFQTLARRDIDLSSYDLVAIDEAHMRYNTAIVKEIRALTCTRLFMTGTPLKPNGSFLDTSIDNIMEFTSAKQMLSDGYLAPTNFYSRFNLLDESDGIGVRNGEYIDQDIERVLDKQAVVAQLVADNQQFNWSTQHKAILYVNSINTATKVCSAFNDSTNVRVIHSKLVKSELASVTDWFDSTPNGILINVRMYTIGVNVPTCDTILYLTPTRITSLFLQSVWRSSTLWKGKVASVFDYSGTINRISPYFDDWTGKKPSCHEACESITDPFERYMCMASCDGEGPMQECTGTLSKSNSMNPYVSNHRIISTDIKPCGELVPVHMNSYRTLDKPDTMGTITKHAKCKCGFHSAYDIATITEPSELVAMYNENNPLPTATVIYSAEHKRAIVVLDNCTTRKFKVIPFTSSEDMYKACVAYFNHKQFNCISNVRIPIIPNTFVDKSIGDIIPLIKNWEKPSNVIKKLIKLKLLSILNYLGIKEGYAYYQMKLITPQTEYATMEFLLSANITKQSLISYFNKLVKE